MAPPLHLVVPTLVRLMAQELSDSCHIDVGARDGGAHVQRDRDLSDRDHANEVLQLAPAQLLRARGQSDLSNGAHFLALAQLQRRCH